MGHVLRTIVFYMQSKWNMHVYAAFKPTYYRRKTTIYFVEYKFKCFLLVPTKCIRIYSETFCISTNCTLCSRYFFMKNFYILQQTRSPSALVWCLSEVEAQHAYTKLFVKKISFFSKSWCVLYLLNSSLTTGNRCWVRCDCASLEISGTKFV